MRIINISLLSLCLSLFLFSCTQEQEHEDEHGHAHEAEAHDHDEEGHHEGEEHHEEGEIHMTPEQLKTMNISFGDFSQVKINDFVRATGTLGLPPNAYSSVSAKTSGFIKDSRKYVEGSYVKRGAVLAYLENPELIQQQQQYLEVTAELSYLMQEMERQQSLLAANAGVEKTLQKTQSQANMKMATQKGIAKQLAYLGIAVKDLTPENIVERIAIYSPLSGYITSIQMHNGMYVAPNVELMEIVDENHLHLELDVFEKDIAEVKEEQRISYTVPALGNTVFDGTVHTIGKEFDRENKTVRIHGHLHKQRPRFIRDLFIEAKIWLNDQTVQALPEGAIIQDGANYYIFVTMNENATDEVEFEKLRVMPSVTDEGFTAVKMIDERPAGSKIVTSGAYYVYSQSIVGELEHSH